MDDLKSKIESFEMQDCTRAEILLMAINLKLDRLLQGSSDNKGGPALKEVQSQGRSMFGSKRNKKGSAK